jgi:hypothetical protein
MSTDEPMAVVAPDLESGPTAHVPEVEEQSSDDDMPLAKGNGTNGNKRAPTNGGRASSSEDERPLVRQATMVAEQRLMKYRARKPKWGMERGMGGPQLGPHPAVQRSSPNPHL